MKIKVPSTLEIEVSAVQIVLPVNYADEDIPYDFPMRKENRWSATVDIDTGKIRDWPVGKSGDLYMKVSDAGRYRLIGPTGVVIALRDNYVPHGVVPGDYGDYVNLQINADGIITNWPKKPDLSEFFDTKD